MLLDLLLIIIAVYVISMLPGDARLKNILFVIVAVIVVLWLIGALGVVTYPSPIFRRY
jgi:hypothetical protein